VLSWIVPGRNGGPSGQLKQNGRVIFVQNRQIRKLSAARPRSAPPEVELPWTVTTEGGPRFGQRRMSSSWIAASLQTGLFLLLFESGSICLHVIDKRREPAQVLTETLFRVHVFTMVENADRPPIIAAGDDF